MALEVLDSALVLLGGGSCLEGSEIAAASGLRVDLARIEAVTARCQLPYHVSISLLSLRAGRASASKTLSDREHCAGPAISPRRSGCGRRPPADAGRRRWRNPRTHPLLDVPVVGLGDAVQIAGDAFSAKSPIGPRCHIDWRAPVTGSRLAAVPI